MNESSDPLFHLTNNNLQSSSFKQSSSEQPLLQLNKTKTSTNDHSGPKYLLITRQNSSETLQKVSPFLIKKAIDSTCEGEVELCKKIQNGKILVKTKNEIQAKKLIELTVLSPEIQVDIEEHPMLNYSKGVIYSNDLRNMSEDEILEEMRNQNVVEVKKILKSLDGEVKETGLIILTFDSPDLPSEIAIGYEKVNIRPYIPLPLRCNKCLSYGHVTKNCNNSKICPNCASDFHTNSVEQCNFSKKCVNCKEVKGQDQYHNAYDKKCPVFLKEKEIQTIMTLKRVDRREAIKRYEERLLHSSKINLANAQAHIAKLQNQNPTNQSTKPLVKPIGAIHTLAATTRAAVKYSYIISESLSPFVTFKDGKVGVNFGGYHAEAGLGGLLTGNAAHGGLSASAGTPWGPQAAAGLNGALDGRAAGGAYAGAQLNPNVGASSVLSGSVGDVNHGFAGAEAHSNRNHVSKTLVQEAPLPPIVPSDTSYNNIQHSEQNGIQKIKPPKKYNVIKVEPDNHAAEFNDDNSSSNTKGGSSLTKPTNNKAIFSTVDSRPVEQRVNSETSNSNYQPTAAASPTAAGGADKTISIEKVVGGHVVSGGGVAAAPVDDSRSGIIIVNKNRHRERKQKLHQRRRLAAQSRRRLPSVEHESSDYEVPLYVEGEAMPIGATLSYATAAGASAFFDNNADAPPSVVHSKQVSKSVIATGDNGYEHKHSDVQVGNGLIGNVLNIPIGILRSLQDSLGGLNIHKSTSQTRV